MKRLRKIIILLLIISIIGIGGKWLGIWWLGILKFSAIRGYTVRYLGKSECMAVRGMPFLIKMLGDDENFRAGWDHSSSPSSEALKVLVKIGSRAVEPLISVLKNEKNSWARHNAAVALGFIKDPRAVELLIYALKDDEYDLVRESAACALGDIKSPQAVSPLICALKDESWSVRYRAALSLEYCVENSRIVEPLINLLKDESEHVREAAISVLGKTKDKHIVKVLISILKDENENRGVRERAIKTLGEIKDVRAVESLIDILKNEDPYIRVAAVHALKQITNQYYLGKHYDSWLKWWEESKEKFSNSR